MYFLPDGTEISHADFLHGQVCYGCGIAKDLTVHHCLFDDVKKHGRKIRQLQDVRNLMPLCSDCHLKRLHKGYKVRVKYWHEQCERYGRDKMVEWVKTVDLLTREKYELLEEK